MEGNYSGWAATGVLGVDSARWIPLWQTLDRYERPRGAAAALLLNYRGFYDGSSWAYFGVESEDLFRQPDGPAATALQQVACFLLRETYLHNLTTNQRLCRGRDTIRAAVHVTNRGREPQAVKLSLGTVDADAADKATGRWIHEEVLRLEPGATCRREADVAAEDCPGDLIRVAARLSIDGQIVDEMETAVVRESRDVLHSAAESRFVDNYFTHGGRPLFLFGSDTYSDTYDTAVENPLTWSQDLRAARDLGVQVYENLQYTRPGFQLDQADWESFRAMAQLTQKYNLVFMPGMLIGQNVAIGPTQLAAQSDLCSTYAQTLHEAPALHYYINGDYRLNLADDPETSQQLWADWLTDRYGKLDALNQAWGSRFDGAIGNVPFPPPDTGLWSDVAAIDRARFEIELTRRWNEGHVRAIRRHDSCHPIMSEYYQRPFGGLDLPLTIDGQDVSDVGYFDEPRTDIEKLPLALRWNDLRRAAKE